MKIENLNIVKSTLELLPYSASALKFGKIHNIILIITAHSVSAFLYSLSRFRFKMDIFRSKVR
jgi:hypothetical protein